MLKVESPASLGVPIDSTLKVLHQGRALDMGVKSIADVLYLKPANSDVPMSQCAPGVLIQRSDGWLEIITPTTEER